ncbi:phosphotransferase enzyme family protein [Streptomyces capitiformicae]|uniref:Aminoglycoside phosphotransferase domain-containing protein n=1 Tax=Streptomyces capitiformicae TaxID=2014920 RepID=A0A919L6P9_9ACTN|nr:phosphotransferase [Streptomyces capitiformicae]GHH84731.1 hypothetical protein GCM10017771_14750 [Streptomyces capitiformicae]
MAASVAEQYELSGAEVIDDLGLWGQTLRLHCRTATGYHFLIKEKAHYLSSEDWPVHLAVHRWSQRAGGPVSPLLSTQAGDDGVIHQGRYFEVQGWVEGRLPTDGDAEEFGRTLALFHLSVAGMPPGSRDRPRCRYRWTPDDPAGLGDYIDRYCRPRAAHGSPAAARLAELRRKVRDLPQDGPAGGLVGSYLHGDTALANTVRTGEGFLRLIDFDDARWGHRIFDLVHAMAITAGFDPDLTGQHAIRTEWALQRAQALFDGYRSLIELTPAEREDFPRQMTVAVIATGLSCLDIDDPEFELPSDLADQLGHLSALVEDVPSLSSAVTRP